MTGYDFHPEVVVDLDEIWDFIAGDNPDAADRLVGEIWPPSISSCLSQGKAMNARISLPVPCGSP
jgi:hypothetical protein